MLASSCAHKSEQTIQQHILSRLEHFEERLEVIAMLMIQQRIPCSPGCSWGALLLWLLPRRAALQAAVAEQSWRNPTVLFLHGLRTQHMYQSQANILTGSTYRKSLPSCFFFAVVPSTDTFSKGDEISCIMLGAPMGVLDEAVQLEEGAAGAPWPVCSGATWQPSSCRAACSGARSACSGRTAKPSVAPASPPASSKTSSKPHACKDDMHRGTMIVHLSQAGTEHQI